MLTTNLSWDVRAVAYHAGNVYVGGTFQNAGGNGNADFLAKWTGTSWQTACNGSPLTATVSALEIVGNTLYVGGSFANGAGLATADFLLACDLTTGAPSSTVLADNDIGAAVVALTADSDGVLYAGGQFINMDGITGADHVAYYDGTWHRMGGQHAVGGIVYSLAASGLDVYVGSGDGGINIGGLAKADHVARWDGAWHALGSDTAGLEDGSTHSPSPTA